VKERKPVPEKKNSFSFWTMPLVMPRSRAIECYGSTSNYSLFASELHINCATDGSEGDRMYEKTLQNLFFFAKINNINGA